MSEAELKAIFLNWNDPTTDIILEARFHLPISIGRGKHNALVLSSSAISRDHARLESAGNELILYDLNSTNGTKINGERIHRATLNDGDSFEMGPFTVTVIFTKSTDSTRSTDAPDEQPTYDFNVDDMTSPANNPAARNLMDEDT